MKRETVKFEVTVELDPIPGAMHTKESAQTFMEYALNVGTVGYFKEVKEVDNNLLDTLKTVLSAHLYDGALTTGDAHLSKAIQGQVERAISAAEGEA